MEYTKPTLREIVGWIIVHCHYHCAFLKEHTLEEINGLSFSVKDIKREIGHQYINYLNSFGIYVYDDNEAKKWESVIELFNDNHHCDYKDPDYDPAFAKMSINEYIDCHRCNDDTLFGLIVDHLGLSRSLLD